MKLSKFHLAFLLFITFIIPLSGHADAAKKNTKIVIDWAKQSETIEKIELNARASNSRAIALYKKWGSWKRAGSKIESR
jgi:hypothetical protein